MNEAPGSVGATAVTRAGFVSLTGWTNVGKSTLLNRLVGERLAAVAPAPQTTRRRILGVRTLPGRAQIAFVDTPGFHRAQHRMNREMLQQARAAVRSVDLVLFVLDASRGLGAGDREVARLVRESRRRAVAALNKIDLVHPKSRLLPLMDELARAWGLEEIVPVSALTGEGCEPLLERVVAQLPESPFLFPEDYLTDQPERQRAAEWIRESLLRQLRQELPHALAVVVERWQKRDDGVLAIEATVLVERESQKAIVIGRGGARLKEVGIQVRRELEGWLGVPVYLRLWVKVRGKWRDDPRVLKDLGLI